jgi:hypothetical protein
MANIYDPSTGTWSRHAAGWMDLAENCKKKVLG